MSIIAADRDIATDLSLDARVLMSGKAYPETWTVSIWVRTKTAGLGTLLVTIDYHDGTTHQVQNVACALTAGNEAKSPFDFPIVGNAEDVYVSYTFLGGIFDGTADCDILLITSE